MDDDLPSQHIVVVATATNKKYKMLMRGDLNLLTVSKVKRYLQAASGVPAPRQILRFNNQLLEDDDTGESLALFDGAIIFMEETPEPPPAPPASAPAQFSYINNQPNTEREMAHSAARKAERLPIPSRPQQQEWGYRADTGIATAHSPSRRAMQDYRLAPRSHEEGVPYTVAPDLSPTPLERIARYPEQEGRRNVEMSRAKPDDRNSSMHSTFMPPQQTSRVHEKEQRPSSFSSPQLIRDDETTQKLTRQEHEISLLRQKIEEMERRELQRTGPQPRDSPYAHGAGTYSRPNSSVERSRQTEPTVSNRIVDRSAGPGEGRRDVQTRLEMNLARFAETIGSAPLALDANQTCVVNIDFEGQSHTVLLTFDPACSRLYIYATIASSLPRDPNARLGLFEILLEGALLGRDMAGGGVGVSTKNEIVLLSTSIDVAHADDGALSAAIVPFLQSAWKWGNAVQEYVQAEQQQAYSQQVPPAGQIPSGYLPQHGRRHNIESSFQERY